MKEHYDIAVTGSELSGLITATLLAKKGLSVLWVDNAEGDGTYQREGVQLPIVPRLLPNLNESAIFKAIHDELGVAPDLRIQIKKPDVGFQFLSPGHRLDVYGDREALEKELKQEYPGLEDAVIHFLERIERTANEANALLAAHILVPPEGFVERWKTRKINKQVQPLLAAFDPDEWLSEIPQGHPLREILLAPLKFFSPFEPEELSLLQVSRALHLVFSGSNRSGGLDSGLRELLLSAAKKAGVEIRTKSRVEEIQTRGKKALSLILKKGNTEASADYFIHASPTRLADLLSKPKLASKCAAQSEIYKARGGAFTINFLLKKSWLPEGISDALFLSGGFARENDADKICPTLFVRIYPDPPKSKKSDDELVLLSATCPVNLREIQHSPEARAQLRGAIESHIKRLVPFLEGGMVDGSVATESDAWQSEKNAPALNVNPWLARAHYAPQDPPAWGVGWRPLSTQLSNVYHIGRDTIPGLGLEGEYMAARAMVAKLMATAGKKWDKKGVIDKF
ncbi:NAD(P)/FAD-dependent oxidoreductase [Myxococcota bacterium]|nr:NAD(P)/FAD-dependent oxidoreductase [Myxococcota bacterium]